jgi:hypothetical protein
MVVVPTAQPLCPHPQAISSVSLASEQYWLQYLLSFPARHVQLG